MTDTPSWAALVATPIATLLAAMFGAGIGGWFTYASKENELHVRLVEVAVAILRDDPKDDVAPVRGWAIRVINENSSVKFTDDETKALMQKRLGVVFAATGLAEGKADVSGGGSWRNGVPAPPR